MHLNFYVLLSLHLNVDNFSIIIEPKQNPLLNMFCHLPALSTPVSGSILHPGALGKSLGVPFESALDLRPHIEYISKFHQLYLQSVSTMQLLPIISSWTTIISPTRTSTGASYLAFLLPLRPPEQPFTAARNIARISSLPLCASFS